MSNQLVIQTMDRGPQCPAAKKCFECRSNIYVALVCKAVKKSSKFSSKRAPPVSVHKSEKCNYKK